MRLKSSSSVSSACEARQADRVREQRLRVFARIVEDVVLCYLMYAALWSLCHVVSAVFERLGVA